MFEKTTLTELQEKGKKLGLTTEQVNDPCFCEKNIKTLEIMIQYRGKIPLETSINAAFNLIKEYENGIPIHYNHKINPKVLGLITKKEAEDIASGATYNEATIERRRSTPYYQSKKQKFIEDIDPYLESFDKEIKDITPTTLLDSFYLDCVEAEAKKLLTQKRSFSESFERNYEQRTPPNPGPENYRS